MCPCFSCCCVYVSFRTMCVCAMQILRGAWWARPHSTGPKKKKNQPQNTTSAYGDDLDSDAATVNRSKLAKLRSLHHVVTWPISVNYTPELYIKHSDKCKTVCILTCNFSSSIALRAVSWESVGTASSQFLSNFNVCLISRTRHNSTTQQGVKALLYLS